MTTPELTISVCEMPGHSGHAARITVADGMQEVTFCLWPENAGFLSEALANVAPRPPVATAAAMARYMEDLATNYPEDVFPASSDSRDAISGTAMRHAYRTAARLIRERAGLPS